MTTQPFAEWRLPYLDRIGVLSLEFRMCGCRMCRRRLRGALNDYDRRRN